MSIKFLALTAVFSYRNPPDKLITEKSDHSKLSTRILHSTTVFNIKLFLSSKSAY